MKASLLILLLTSLVLPVHAGTRWYQVELLIFARTGKAALASEFWPTNPGYPALQHATPLLPAGGANREPYRLLPSSALRLTKYKQQLAKASGLRPILHVAWNQPGMSKTNAPEVHLSGGRRLPNAPSAPPSLAQPGSGVIADDRFDVELSLPRNADPNAEVDGRIKVWVARYLHLDVDLIFRRLLKAPLNPDSQAGNGQYLQHFRMRQVRRMRSKDLHYLDHPAFGVLALITPI